MKKLILSLIITIIGIFAISHGYAIFDDLVAVKDNTFYAGRFDVQLSILDDDNNGIGDVLAWDWDEDLTHVQVWSTPTQWMPGDTLNKVVFIRNQGEVDADSLYMTMTNRAYSPGAKLDTQINLLEAWYDRNANGVQEDGENILADLKTHCAVVEDEPLTLKTLYDALDVTQYGEMFDLEPGEFVLPGGDGGTVIGGYTGTGKGLFLTWQFEPTASVSYQDTYLDFDLELHGVQFLNEG